MKENEKWEIKVAVEDGIVTEVVNGGYDAAMGKIKSMEEGNVNFLSFLVKNINVVEKK